MERETKYRILPEFPNYGICESGEILDLKSGATVPSYYHHQHRTMVVAIRNRKFKTVKPIVARLVLMAYYPLPEAKAPFVSVTFLDRDRTNVALTNLQWNFEVYRPPFVPGVNIREEDFVPIPGYAGYEINSLGVVRNANGVPVAVGGKRHGYPTVSLVPSGETRTRTVLVHRLVGLVFLEHPIDTSHLVINHKDGNTENFAISNLEWCTYSHNSKHAYVAGLRTENDHVLAMEIASRKVRRFISLGECAAFFGVTAGAIHFQLNQKKEIRPYKGFYLKYADDLTPWPKKTAVFKRTCSSGDPIIVKRLSDGHVERYASIRQFAKLINISEASVLYQVRKEVPTPYKGYLVMYDRPGAVFPEYGADELFKHSIASNSKAPVKVYDSLTNTIENYRSLGYFCKQAKLRPASVREAMWLRDGKYAGYYIEYL